MALIHQKPLATPESSVVEIKRYLELHHDEDKGHYHILERFVSPGMEIDKMVSIATLKDGQVYINHEDSAWLLGTFIATTQPKSKDIPASYCLLENDNVIRWFPRDIRAILTVFSSVTLNTHTIDLYFPKYKLKSVEAMYFFIVFSIANEKYLLRKIYDIFLNHIHPKKEQTT